MVLVLHDCKFGMAEVDINRIEEWFRNTSKPDVKIEGKEKQSRLLPLLKLLQWYCFELAHDDLHYYFTNDASSYHGYFGMFINSFSNPLLGSMQVRLLFTNALAYE